MIISRTPLRMSFLGGGSDLPAYYRHEQGAVISTAINKYIYITVNEKFDSKVRASYSVTEIVDRPRDLKHELIREALSLVGIDGGIEITSISDIPSQGTGLGSSSTYTVGLLNALHAWRNCVVSAERLAQEACIIEMQRCAKPIGKQDQYIAAYGGFQFLQFNPDESVYVDPVVMRYEDRQRLRQALLMLYTGTTRSSSGVLQEQQNNLENSVERRMLLGKMVRLAWQVRDALQQGNLDGFGEALHEGWQLKRQLAGGISNPQIDHWYDRAREAGAIGGKILGAGGGGFLLLYAPPEKHPAIRAALPGLRDIRFRFESQGSKIIYVEENGR
jgi:D-glycero-alpha-D-manno-heptose-7-phosphate kinase